MDKTLLWIWFTAKRYVSPRKKLHLWEVFGDVERIFSEESFDDITWLSPKEKNELLDKDLAKAREISLRTRKIGGRIVTYEDSEYPELLKNIDDPPFVLYIRGEKINVDKSMTIGVVGTRRNSGIGHDITHDICYDLAQKGVIIVSGLARGIDTIASATAVNMGGRSIAVLGCGLDVIYPPENGNLYEKIANAGMLVTEYPVGMRAYPSNFPRRNRIIAGLSRGVLVTEAPKTSGSLITARQAMENGRDVFAVPRAAKDYYCGTNRLIQQGAKLVCSAEDILVEYPYMEKTLIPIKTPKYRKEDVLKKKELLPKNEQKNHNNEYKERYNEIYNKCDDTQKKLIEIIAKEEIHIDEIVRNSGLEIAAVNTALMMMEMNGYIKKHVGNKYSIKL